MMFLRSVLSLLLISSLALAQPETEGPEEQLPTLADLITPGVKELLTGPKRDWIVLNTDEVLIVESVSPRPDTINKRLEQIEQTKEARNQASGRERDRLNEELAALDFLEVTIPTEEGTPEFKLPIKQVKQIIHHEDHVIHRIDKLLEEKQVVPALELLDYLQKTWETWPDMTRAYHDILLTDAQVRIENGKPELALVVIDELYNREKNYQGLQEMLGDAIKILVDEALQQENYLRAQFFLNRLQQRYADHPVYKFYDQQLNDRVNAKFAKASAAADQGDYRTASIEAEEAALIWPKAPELRKSHRGHVERYQRLHVGVVDWPGECQAYPVTPPADQRQGRLTELPLFEIDRLRDGTAYYKTRFFDEWEPLDLGREMRFTLKQFRQPSEMQNVLTTVDVVTPLLERIDPDSARYDERLAAFVSSIEINSPTSFSLIFKRVPPRIEPLLSQLTLGKIDERDLAFGPLSDPGGFQISDQNSETITYTRELKEPDNLPKYHVAEVIEHHYSTHEKAVQALRRGEVAMLPDVPDWILNRMLNDEEFMKRYFVLPYMMPVTHLLQFNPQSDVLKIRELRIALAYAVDRDHILKDIVLRDPKGLRGRIVSTPFLSSNPGRNVLVEPRRFDLSAGLAMALAAQKQLQGQLPELTMVVAPGIVEELAAKEIAATWNRIGFKVKVVKASDPAPQSWDILYRTTQMAEPVIEMWPFLTMQDSAQLADLDQYPDWLKQELVQLDRTSDQSRAISALQMLHRHLQQDSAVVPLWEIDKYLVVRKNLQGFPQTPVHCYDEIDRWSVDAWYQTELP